MGGALTVFSMVPFHLFFKNRACVLKTFLYESGVSFLNLFLCFLNLCCVLKSIFEN
jgi:hypothetical protein